MNKTANIFLSLFAALAVVLGGVTPALAFTAPNGDVQRILDDTNAARSAGGLPPLTLDESLTAVAQSWSQRQATDGRMYHNPDYSSQIPSGWSGAAENVAYGYAVSEVTSGWMSSEGHRKNILGDYSSIGIGIQDGYYTQVFAKYSNGSSAPVPVKTETTPQEPLKPTPEVATPQEAPAQESSPQEEAPTPPMEPPAETIPEPATTEDREAIEPKEVLPEDDQIMTIQGDATAMETPAAAGNTTQEKQSQGIPKPLLVGILVGAGLLLIGAVIALMFVLRKK